MNHDALKQALINAGRFVLAARLSIVLPQASTGKTKHYKALIAEIFDTTGLKREAYVIQPRLK